MRAIDTIIVTDVVWVRLRSVIVRNVCTSSSKAAWGSSWIWSLFYCSVSSDEMILVSTVLTFYSQSTLLSLRCLWFEHSFIRLQVHSFFYLSCKNWPENIPYVHIPTSDRCLVNNVTLPFLMKWVSDCFCCNNLKLIACPQYYNTSMLLHIMWRF